NFVDIPVGLLSVGAIDFGIIVDGAVIMADSIVYRLSSMCSDRPRGNYLPCRFGSSRRGKCWTLSADGRTLKEGDIITLNGTRGMLSQGDVNRSGATETPSLADLMKLVDQCLPRGEDTTAFSVPASDDIKVSTKEAKVRTFNSAQKRVIDSLGGNDDVRVADSIGLPSWRMVAPAMTCSKEMPAMA